MIHFQDESVTVHHGDALDVLRTLPDCSVDAVVTDPPAGIGFMGRAWDDHKGGRQQWVAWLAEVMAEALRVAKPGAHAFVWALPRTSHWTACAIEDAGWTIRDRCVHLFGSGFPKSLDVSKAIDRIRDWTLVERLAGEIRRARGVSGLSLAEIGEAMQAATGGQYGKWYHRGGHMFHETGRSLPSRPEWEHLRRVLPIAEEFAEVFVAAERERLAPQRRVRPSAAIAQSGFGADGWAPQSKEPATDDARRWEGWGTALKPAAEDWWLARKPFPGSVASNVLEWGTGALNIDGCRVGTEARVNNAGGASSLQRVSRVEQGYRSHVTTSVGEASEVTGRWPSNVTLDEYAATELDRDSGIRRPGEKPAAAEPGPERHDGWGMRRVVGEREVFDAGGASRFFPVFKYEPKAPTSERPRDGAAAHPTVKPLDLMRWLVRLVTPPGGGVVLDPFAGSGTTAEACIVEGFRCITVEREAAYLPLIMARLSKPIQPTLVT